MKKAKGKSNIAIVTDMLNGERPFTQIGYEGEAEKPFKDREIGEIWSDKNGKQWIKMEHGGVRSYNPKADIIKEEVNKKWICKRCDQSLRFSHTKHDEKFLNRTGICFDCITEYETELRFKGLYPQYEKKKILENQLSYAKDMKSKLRESFKYTKDNPVLKYVNSNGFIEEWKNESRTELMSSMLADYKECLRAIQRIENELKTVPHIPRPDESKRSDLFKPIESLV